MQRTETRYGVVQSRPLPVRGGIALVLSVLVNVAIVFVVGALGVASGFQPLTLPPVVFLSAVGGIGALGVYALLKRYVDRPDRTFRRVAAVVLVLSFVPDLGLLIGDPAATVPGVVTLMIMHCVVAAIAVEALVGIRDERR